MAAAACTHDDHDAMAVDDDAPQPVVVEARAVPVPAARSLRLSPVGRALRRMMVSHHWRSLALTGACVAADPAAVRSALDAQETHGADASPNVWAYEVAMRGCGADGAASDRRSTHYPLPIEYRLPTTSTPVVVGDPDCFLNGDRRGPPTRPLTPTPCVYTVNVSTDDDDDVVAQLGHFVEANCACHAPLFQRGRVWAQRHFEMMMMTRDGRGESSALEMNLLFRRDAAAAADEDATVRVGVDVQVTVVCDDAARCAKLREALTGDAFFFQAFGVDDDGARGAAATATASASATTTTEATATTTPTPPPPPPKNLLAGVPQLTDVVRDPVDACKRSLKQSEADLKELRSSRDELRSLLAVARRTLNDIEARTARYDMLLADAERRHEMIHAFHKMIAPVVERAARS